MNPVPTPYDIIDSLIFPYLPGLVVWISVALLGMIALGLIYLYHRPAARKTLSPLSILESSLRLELDPAQLKPQLSQLSIAIRRALELEMQLPGLESASNQELKKQLDDIGLSELAVLLLELDNLRFAPELDLKVCQEKLIAIRAIIKQLSSIESR
jgi:hypothetical protein